MVLRRHSPLPVELLDRSYLAVYSRLPPRFAQKVKLLHSAYSVASHSSGSYLVLAFDRPTWRLRGGRREVRAMIVRVTSRKTRRADLTMGAFREDPCWIYLYS